MAKFHIRTVNKAKPVESVAVERYLEDKFGEAFRLYEEFRLGIPDGRLQRRRCQGPSNNSH